MSVHQQVKDKAKLTKGLSMADGMPLLQSPVLSFGHTLPANCYFYVHQQVGTSEQSILQP